jgi:hypothetical protein
MASITIERQGEQIEVYVGRDGFGGVVAETIDGKEYPLNSREEDWAWTVLTDAENFEAMMGGPDE